jgi:hypothetical protein
MFNSGDLERLFGIDDFTNPIKPHTTHNIKDIEYIPYHINKYGFRSSDFNNKELLALGCSMTHGLGIHEEYRWSNILSGKLKKSLANLGYSGDSAIGQLNKAFWYFKNFGNPKIIAALFPLYRMSFPYIPNKNISEQQKNWRKEDFLNYKQTSIIPNVDSFEKFSKSPHRLEDVVSYESTLFYTNLAISVLDQYCKSNNIKFVWSVWDGKSIPQFGIKDDSITEEALKYFEKEYDSYLAVDCLLWNIDKNGIESDSNGRSLECHSEFKYNPLFHRAADTLNGLDRAHFGLHRNIHIAESFYDKLYKESYD